MAQLIKLVNIDVVSIVWKIKLASVISSIFFGSLAVYFIVIFQKLVGFKIETIKALLRSSEPASGGALASRWEEIMRHLDSEKEAEWKFAIIEADKLVDSILKSAGYPGDTMGDRLMSIEKGQLLSLEGLWDAHKVRNKLAHETNYFLRYAEARRAVDLYRSALQELKAI